VWVKPGIYQVHATALDFNGQATGEQMADQQINVVANKMLFLNWRSFH
jgi:hypothetical protein